MFFSCRDDDNINSIDFFKANCCNTPHLQASFEGTDLYLPNSFTPNGDGANDFFYPIANTNSTIEIIESFRIFKLNDELVYEIENILPNQITTGWDGVIEDGNNNRPIDGIYSYILVVVNTLGEQFIFNGKVCARGTKLPVSCVEHEDQCVYSRQHNGGVHDAVFPSGEENTLREDCQ